MIPIFPNFKRLEIEDREEINQIVCQYSPYSDYNFTSLWSWDVEGNSEVSRSQNYLIFKFPDYLTGKKHFCIAGGGENFSSLVNEIFQLCKKEGYEEKIKLVPEETIRHGEFVDNKNYIIVEDENNHDYILSIKKVVDLQGRSLHSHRKLINQFKKQNPDLRGEKLDVSSEKIRSEIMELFSKWADFKKVKKDDYFNEKMALERHLIISLHHPDSVFFVGIYNKDNVLVAFISNEIVHNSYAIGHFQKALPEYRGVYQYLIHISLSFLKELGVSYYNMEQDLGIETLRGMKKNWDPEFFLKKFILMPA